jgi:hypothetical protein
VDDDDVCDFLIFTPAIFTLAIVEMKMMNSGCLGFV